MRIYAYLRINIKKYAKIFTKAIDLCIGLRKIITVQEINGTAGC